MYDPLVICQSVFTLIFSSLMMVYSFKLLTKFKRNVVTIGRIFLKKERLSDVALSFIVAFSLVLLSLFAINSEIEVIVKTGRIISDISLPFFFYALYKFYGMIK